jgi:hypothetical protein
MNKQLIYAALLFAIVILVVTGRLYQLNKTNFDIDILGNQLAPIKKLLPSDASVGFYTNRPSAMFIETEYIMAPLVLQNRLDCDTILTIRDTTIKTYDFRGYKAICTTKQGVLIVSLMIKNK